MFAEQSGSNTLTLVNLLSSANWSACKQSGYAELRCVRVATIALHPASLVSFCIAYLQLPLTITSLDKCIWVQYQAASFVHSLHAVLTSLHTVFPYLTSCVRNMCPVGLHCKNEFE